MTIPTASASLIPGARNATLDDLAALLRDEPARKVDIVASATAIHREGAGGGAGGPDPSSVLVA